MLDWLFRPPGIPIIEDIILFYQWTARLEGFIVGSLCGAFFGLAIAGVMALLARK